MPKQPQDHQPAKGKPFTFVDVEGKRHTLPNASVGLAKLPGRALRDAALGGDVGQLAYLFKLVEAADPDAEVIDALYGLPQDEMVEILEAWGNHGDGDGASLGE